MVFMLCSDPWHRPGTGRRNRQPGVVMLNDGREPTQNDNIESARQLIYAAFRTVTNPKQNPVAYFSGQKQKTVEVRVRRSTAHQVHATATRATGRSYPPLSDRQPLAGSVHAIINNAPPMFHHWINLAYRDSGFQFMDSIARFPRLFSDEYIPAHVSPSAQAGTRASVREMITFRVGQSAGVIHHTAKYEPQNGALSPDAWKKTLRHHWQAIGDELRRVDDDALLYVWHQQGA